MPFAWPPPPGVRLSGRGGTPASVSLRPNRRSPRGAARFHIDVVGGWGITSGVCPRMRQMLSPVPPPRRSFVLLQSTAENHTSFPPDCLRDKKVERDALR